MTANKWLTHCPAVVLVSISLVFLSSARSQTITGAWRGKINQGKIELKLVKSGDSLLGTSYYYQSNSRFRRYSVKGYFDPETNQVIWWDDALIEESTGKNGMGNDASEALLSVADFNCPGEEEMLLDGNSNLKDDKDSRKRVLHLQKVSQSLFPDEWDYVLENYLVGANDPEIIDSIAHLRSTAPLMADEEWNASMPVAIHTEPLAGPAPSVNPYSSRGKPASMANEQKFANRKKVLQTVIPITAKTIELRFYDNAQIDGDSIALFLNGRMIFEHIFLTDKPYTIHIDANELAEDNELVMVAENLGSIPPNTSFMVAIVGDKRYEARLFANENSSALIRLVKGKRE